MTGFTGQLFMTMDDKDIALELLRAYNDWHVEDWCGTYPGRMIPLAVPPVWDPELMADEVRRMADKGCHAVTFSENPEKLGCPSWHSDHWDPFLRPARRPARSSACTSGRRPPRSSPPWTRRSTP